MFLGKMIIKFPQLWFPQKKEGKWKKVHVRESREREICNLPPIPVKTVNGENVSFVLIDRLFSADLYKKLDSW